MAQRRLFSPDIICSDDFLEMPTSSRDLYVQLAIRADDDGFVSPRGIMKLLGSSEDDLKVLIAKRFLLEFESGVIVIKHWLIHNTIRKDRYKSTRYLEEKSSLRVKENGAYTEYSEDGVKLLPSWQPNGNQMAAQVKLSQDKSPGESEIRVESFSSKEEDREVRTKGAPKYPHAKEVFGWFPSQEKSWLIDTTQLKHAELLYERGEAKVKGALSFAAKHRDDYYFPKITKPSDLERKWNDLAAIKV